MNSFHISILYRVQLHLWSTRQGRLRIRDKKIRRNTTTACVEILTDYAAMRFLTIYSPQHSFAKQMQEEPEQWYLYILKPTISGGYKMVQLFRVYSECLTALFGAIKNKLYHPYHQPLSSWSEQWPQSHSLSNSLSCQASLWLLLLKMLSDDLFSLFFERSFKMAAPIRISRSPIWFIDLRLISSSGHLTAYFHKKPKDNTYCKPHTFLDFGQI